MRFGGHVPGIRNRHRETFFGRTRPCSPSFAGFCGAHGVHHRGRVCTQSATGARWNQRSRPHAHRRRRYWTVFAGVAGRAIPRSTTVGRIARAHETTGTRERLGSTAQDLAQAGFRSSQENSSERRAQTNSSYRGLSRLATEDDRNVGAGPGSPQRLSCFENWARPRAQPPL